MTVSLSSSGCCCGFNIGATYLQFFKCILSWCWRRNYSIIWIYTGLRLGTGIDVTVVGCRRRSLMNISVRVVGMLRRSSSVICATIRFRIITDIPLQVWVPMHNASVLIHDGTTFFSSFGSAVPSRFSLDMLGGSRPRGYAASSFCVSRVIFSRTRFCVSCNLHRATFFSIDFFLSLFTNNVSLWVSLFKLYVFSVILFLATTCQIRLRVRLNLCQQASVVFCCKGGEADRPGDSEEHDWEWNYCLHSLIVIYLDWNQI